MELRFYIPFWQLNIEWTLDTCTYEKHVTNIFFFFIFLSILTFRFQIFLFSDLELRHVY